MDWNNIVIFLFSASSISGIILYIGKRIIDKSLDLALEKYKSSLALEFETHKKNQKKILYEQQVKFNNLHQDRLLIIRSFNSKLYELEKILRNLTTMAQTDERDLKREEDTRIILNKLRDLLEINRIYFKDEICIHLEDIIADGDRFLQEMISIKNKEIKYNKKLQEYQKEFSDTSSSKKPSFNEWIGEDTVAPFNNWLFLELEVQNKIKNARTEMINEFRKFIGVE